MSTLSCLDQLLRRVLVDGMRSLGSGAVTEDQISFVPPDTDWAQKAPAGPRISIYLVDVRENLQLRSNERIERPAAGAGRPSGAVVARRMPYRMDCHYLIAALAPVPGEGTPPPPLQHTLLHEATAALVRSQPLIPAKVYPPGEALLDDWSEEYRDIELPMVVNPHEGFPKLGEFWGTLGAPPHPWRPVVYVIVTIPVERLDAAPVGTVLRRTTIYRAGVNAETRVEIGGFVLASTGEPTGRAWVSAGVISAGQRIEQARTASDDEGRFVLRLPDTATHLWAAAFGVGVTPTLDVSVASANSDFTLRFT